MDLSVTENFIKNIHATYGDIGKQWLDNLPQHIKLLSKKMNFDFIHIVPELSYNLVAIVKLYANNVTGILKTGPLGAAIIPEARWLQYFHTVAPVVYTIEEEQNAFLMERLIPGDTLKSLVISGKDEQATRILCQTILELHSEHLHSSWKLLEHNFPVFKPISELAKAFTFLNGHLEDTMISKAKNLFHDLSKDCKTDVLLHGDLHHDNILKNGLSWKIIDPHGYTGDPAAECGPTIYNPLDCFPNHRSVAHIIDSRLKIFCEMLPFDPKRIKAWAYCRTLLAAAWDIEDFGKIISNKIEIAKMIDKTKI